MAVDLGLDTALSAVTSKGNADTGWHTALRTFLDAAMLSTGNPFGSAALRDAGDVAGQVPVLGAGGKLAASLVPALDAADVSGAGTFTESQIAIGSIPPANYTSGTLPFGNVPPFDASKITSGTFALARLPVRTGATALNTAVTVRTRLTVTRLATERTSDRLFAITGRTLALSLSGSTVVATITAQGSARVPGEDGT